MARLSKLVLCFGCALVAVLLGGRATAEYNEFRLYLDLDNKATTGCTVNLAQGSFAGTDEVLYTTADAVDTTANVVKVERSICVDGSLGSRQLLTSPPITTPWPVGIGNGTDGENVIETFLPLSRLTGPPMRVGLASAPNDSVADSATSDAMLVVGNGNNTPILVDRLPLLPVPALSKFGLILLVVLLTGGAIWSFRRNRLIATVLLLATFASTAWAITIILDGETNEWTAADRRATDGAGDNTGGPDLRALYAAVDQVNGGIAFRIDASLVVNHTPGLSFNITPLSGPVGTTFCFHFTVTDPDAGQTHTFTLIDVGAPDACPQGSVTFTSFPDPQTACLQTEPTEECPFVPGKYSPLVRVTDSGTPPATAEATHNFNITQ